MNSFKTNFDTSLDKLLCDFGTHVRQHAEKSNMEALLESFKGVVGKVQTGMCQYVFNRGKRIGETCNVSSKSGTFCVKHSKKTPLNKDVLEKDIQVIEEEWRELNLLDEIRDDTLNEELYEEPYEIDDVEEADESDAEEEGDYE